MTTHDGSSSRAAETRERGDRPIKVSRLTRGLSTAMLAGMCGLALERIEAIEVGEQATDAELWKIARALDIPFDVIGL